MIIIAQLGFYIIFFRCSLARTLNNSQKRKNKERRSPANSNANFPLRAFFVNTKPNIASFLIFFSRGARKRNMARRAARAAREKLLSLATVRGASEIRGKYSNSSGSPPEISKSNSFYPQQPHGCISGRGNLEFLKLRRREFMIFRRLG